MRPQRFVVTGRGAQRSIAFLRRDGDAPTVVWLGGFRSDMRATKATALDRWAGATGRAFLRFDYSGHGESGGDFADGTIGAWLEESLAILERAAGARPVLVGSSMGGWIALLAALALRRAGLAAAPAGIVLIAPAVDFTQVLMWQNFPDAVKREIESAGRWLRPSDYSPEPYPITKALIEEGRNHLLFGAPIEPGCPVHILQGMQDPDVPWRHAMRLVEHLPADQVALTLIKDGDHRLSREEDIALLTRTVAAMVENVGG